jgi:hypothetical protein
LVIGALALAMLWFAGHRHVTPSEGPADQLTPDDPATAARRGLTLPPNAPELQPDHLIPASQVPAPPMYTAGKQPQPPRVIEPPNPITHRLPMINPNGVNGDRPPRVVTPPPPRAAPNPGDIGH